MARSSTPLLIGAIAIVSAAASFGAVRAWFPHVQAAPVAMVAKDFNVPHEIGAAEAGRLSIVTDPAGARVEIDGRPRGVSPVVIGGLAAANHLVSVASEAGAAERTIAVSKDVMTEVVFSLRRPDAPLAGWVKVASRFPVEMLENSEVVGASGAAKIMLAAGRHDVVLRNDSLGFEAARTITVAPGRVTPVEIDAPMGLLNVNARPWADVSIDGEMVGQTPLSSLSLPIGPHQVTFRHPQLGERTEGVVVKGSGVNRVAVDMNDSRLP
jgi:eukaryotic-like serine/threonine-protein kinase